MLHFNAYIYLKELKFIIQENYMALQPCSKESSCVSAQYRNRVKYRAYQNEPKSHCSRSSLLRGLMGGKCILGLSEGNARSGKMMINIGI